MNRSATIKWYAVFMACFLYWGYLFFTSSIEIVHDASGYEGLGRMIYEKGWKQYFITGPHREPLYVFTIALSMKLGEVFSVSYHYWQKFFQILMLFSSQLFVLQILNKLKIRTGIKMITVLYIGFSPALVNAAFSLYSEVMSFPFVPVLLLFCLFSFETIRQKKNLSVCLWGGGTAIAFILVTFCKGIFLYVFQCLAGCLFLLALYFGFKKKTALRNVLILYLLCMVLSYALGVGSFMAMNRHYNGKFELTDRYAGALFGVAYKRANPVTSRIILSHIAAIPGWGFCRMFFSEEECRYTEFHASDMYYMGPTLQDRLKQIPEDERYKATIKYSFEKIFEHPFQYAMFCLIEAPKIFFWESTRIGFVTYPQWLHNIFVYKPVRLGIRLIVSLLTVIAVIYLLIYLMKNRRAWQAQGPAYERVHLRLEASFVILLIVLFFAGLYSLFLILTRYALPIASLYLIAIALWLDEVIPPEKGRIE